ncbi:MAG: hypothetical protein IJ272_10190 [Clostridia bacterium]|nr:hypothetical protein [Clostridia bacterium]
MKNKYVSIRDVLIFILGILTAVFLWMALITIRRIFWMLFRLCFTVFILLVIIKIVQMVIKKKKNKSK